MLNKFFPHIYVNALNQLPNAETWPRKSAGVFRVFVPINEVVGRVGYESV